MKNTGKKHSEKSIKNLKKAWVNRKKRVASQGVVDSAFTNEERKAFSIAKLQHSNNIALIYLRELGIKPNRHDGFHKAIRKLIVNEYKNPMLFYLQFLNVIEQCIKKNVEVNVFLLFKKINQSRVLQGNSIYIYSGELWSMINKKVL